jgi:ribonuclease-3
MDSTRLDQFDAEQRLHFRDRTLLQQAFVHRSYLNEQINNDASLADNERLEFLGDSVIGFVVSDLLYRRFPTAREGELTHLRTMLVRRETLAALAMRMEMGSLLLLGVGEEDSGGRHRPATLCACFEALVGALFLDQGLDKVRDFITPAVEAVLAPMRLSLMPKDPKSRFQEWAQRTINTTPRYRVVDQSGPDHLKTFITVVTLKNEVMGVGKGNSKQDASQAAAASALYRAGEDAPEHVPDAEIEARWLPPPESEAAESAADAVAVNPLELASAAAAAVALGDLPDETSEPAADPLPPAFAATTQS